MTAPLVANWLLLRGRSRAHIVRRTYPVGGRVETWCGLRRLGPPLDGPFGQTCRRCALAYQREVAG